MAMHSNSGCGRPELLARYFAYGSNMNAARVQDRGLHVLQRRGAILEDHRLVFDKIAQAIPDSGHANIVRSPGEQVEGALYDLGDTLEILKMDWFERTPVNYSREAVIVRMGEQRLAAWTYYANAARRAPDLRPERAYLEHLLAGSDLLSTRYSAWLAATICSDPQ